jgi:hypothetical protein
MFCPVNYVTRVTKCFIVNDLKNARYDSVYLLHQKSQSNSNYTQYQVMTYAEVEMQENNLGAR